MKNKNLSPERAVKTSKFTLLAIFLLIVGVFLLVKTAAIASDITVENLIKLTNKERLKNNLEPLSASPILEKAAKNKADDLLNGQYFSHTSPNGKNFAEWIKEADYQYIYAGENLAMDFITSEGVVKAWMESAGHKKNILSPNYNELAIAVREGKFEGRPTIMVAQLFGRPKSGTDEVNFLTLSNFNAIIKKPGSLVFPSIINSAEASIVNLNDKREILDISLAIIEKDAPFKNNFKIAAYSANPKVAGESTAAAQVKNSFSAKNFSIYISLLFLFLVTYTFSFGVNFLYKHTLIKKFIYDF